MMNTYRALYTKNKGEMDIIVLYRMATTFTPPPRPGYHISARDNELAQLQSCYVCLFSVLSI